MNLKRKTSISYKSFITQAWNFAWNLQQCKKLSLTHLKLHTFKNSKTTHFKHSMNRRTLFHTFTLKLGTFKNLKNKFFTLEKLTTLWRNLFHTYHSLRNGLLLLLQQHLEEVSSTPPIHFANQKSVSQKESLHFCMQHKLITLSLFLVLTQCSFSCLVWANNLLERTWKQTRNETFKVDEMEQLY
jgi:hypothetical protein